MSLLVNLEKRAENKCELCSSTEELSVYTVPPHDGEEEDKSALICSVCKGQIEDYSKIDVNHWHCLNESMWSQVFAVQVIAWRMLNQLKSESWAIDLSEQLYLEDSTLDYAKAAQEDDSGVVIKDSHGAVLKDGDSVTLIKDLDVKGGGFTAKRGTMVKNISLNGVAGQIEGRVNGVHIVLLTQYLKKANS